MKVTAWKNVDIEVDVDVSVDDMLNEMLSRTDAESLRSDKLRAIDAASRTLELIGTDVLGTLGNSKADIAQRLSARLAAVWQWCEQNKGATT